LIEQQGTPLYVTARGFSRWGLRSSQLRRPWRRGAHNGRSARLTRSGGYAPTETLSRLRSSRRSLPSILTDTTTSPCRRHGATPTDADEKLVGRSPGTQAQPRCRELRASGWPRANAGITSIRL
jgi:hypothetical protein